MNVGVSIGIVVVTSVGPLGDSSSLARLVPRINYHLLAPPPSIHLKEKTVRWAALGGERVSAGESVRRR